jgi:4-amino-4-deoxy-L-arabinose transferase-like glycosyltransferase
MDSRVRRVAAVGLALSIVLALLGQYYFATKPGFWWDGIVIYAVAMIFFSVAARRLETAPEAQAKQYAPRLWQQLMVIVRRHGIRSLLVAWGVLSVLYVTSASLKRPHSQSFWDLLVVWLLGTALTVGAFVPWNEVPAALKAAWRGLKRRSVEVTVLALITLAACLLRLVDVEHIPFVLSGDEASMGLEAVDVLRGGRTNPFVTGWFSNPTLYFFFQAAFIKVLGQTVTAIRLSSVLVSSATVILLYIFTRHFYGRWVALLSAIFLATYHYSIHYGRMALNNIWDPLLSLGGFYFFARGLETKRLGHWLMAALFVGFSVYFHAGSRLTELMMATYFLYWLLRDRAILRGNMGNVAVFLLVVVVIVLPLFSFFATHPNDMMAPWQRRAIFATGWVDEQVQSTGQSVAAILTKQFVKSVLAFNAAPDTVFHYHPGIPLLQFVPSIFFVFGLAYSVRKIREPRYFLLVLWFLGVIVFGAWLLENPPSSHRLLLAIPPVVICVALGVSRLVAYTVELLQRPRTTSYVLSLALVLLFSFQSVSFYFNEYTPSHVFGGGNTEVADRMGKYLRVLGSQYECYFFGAPRMYYGFSTIRYLAPDTMGIDLEQPVTDGASFVSPDRDAVFIFLPERIAEFDVVRRAYPTGLKREFRDKLGRILFVSYEVDI